MELRLEDCLNATCPWSGEAVSGEALMLWNGQVVGFCNPECRDKFARAQDFFRAHAERLFQE